MKSKAIDLTDVILDPDNVRKHDQRSIKAIADSLREFGQRKPIVVDSTNRVITGNGTTQAAKELGWKQIQAVYLPEDWTVEKIKAFAIADNRTSELSEWDDQLLLDQLQNLAEVEIDNVGFTQDEINDLIEFRENPFKTIRMNISDLKPHPQNYQLHPDNQLEQIIESIKTHGFYRNIIVAKDNTILAGHGVVEATKKMGRKRVPVIKLMIDPDEPKALKVLTSDNEINNLAKVDDRALTELLKDLLEIEGHGALLGTGFNEDQLAALAFTTRPASEVTTYDTAAEWVGMVDFEKRIDPPTLNVKFDSPEERDDFMKMIGATIINKKMGDVWTLWYPEREREDLKSIRFEQDDQA